MAGITLDQRPDRAAVEGAIDAIAASEHFRKAERCLRLLRYLTSATLEGRESELKEYTIAVSALGRPESFDPRTDPVVRLEARRLRLKLAEYYQQTGAGDAVTIELPKGGYVPQFLCRHIAADEPRAEAVGDGRGGRRWLVSAAACLLLAGTAMAFYALGRSGVGSARGSVAVLQFRDNSSTQNLGYFAEGLRDGLTSALVRTKGMDVTARVSSGQSGGGAESAVEAARRLQADTVVSGSVTPADGQTQAMVALIDGKSGKYLWSKTYLTTTADLALIEHNAALGIAQALGHSGEVAAPHLPQNGEIAELYLRALSLAHTRHMPEVQEAAGLFDRVMRAEPDFAPAYAAAGANYIVAAQNGGLKWSEVGARGMELARKALALDPTLADGHATLAAGWQAQWKWTEAEAEVGRAIELDPRSPVPHYRRAYMLAILQRFPEAEKEIGVARGLDPSWIAAHGLLGEIYYYARRYDDARKIARSYESSSPEFFDNLAARVDVAEGKTGTARALWAKLQYPFAQDMARAMSGDVQGGYADLQARRGTPGVTAFHLAYFSSAELKDRKLTFEWLERSLEEHDPDLVSLAIDPVFDWVRGDPRAVAILRQLNLSGAGVTN